MEYKLICFDVDGTLITGRGRRNYWNLLHSELLGRRGMEFNRKICSQFFSGRISYAAWVGRTLEKFRKAKVTKKDFQKVARNLDLTGGTEKLLAALKKRKYKIAIISGSLDILVETLLPKVKFDEVFINRVFFKGGLISGWSATRFDQGKKAGALRIMCEREGISASEAIFVGDSHNDVDALRAAGLGIAFHPKDLSVESAADAVVRRGALDRILKIIDSAENQPPG
ncbi:MAG: HAD family phosphatase [archaeon]